MRIAVACNGLEVAPLFIQSLSYMCYTVTCGVITDTANVPLVEKLDANVITMLKQLEIDVLIVGHIDEAARACLTQNGFEVVANKSGSANEAVASYLSELFAPEAEWADDDWDD